MWCGPPKWLYECIKRIALRVGCTENEATAIVHDERSTPMWARERSNKFLEAMNAPRAEVEFMNKKQRRTLVREEIMKLLVPLAEFIVRKEDRLEATAAASAKHSRLVGELKTCTNKARAKEIVQELERLEKLLLEQSQYLAFKEKAEKKMKYIHVAQYQDEWTSVDGGRLRAWCACLREGKKRLAKPCGTVIASKRWPRRFDDPSSSRQKWYCACCKVKYATRWGMLVEVVARSMSFFCCSPVTEGDIEDVRAMYLEKKMPSRFTPQQLYDSIKDVESLRPVQHHEAYVADMNLKADDLEYSWKNRDITSYESLPMFSWEQIFTFFRKRGACLQAGG